MKGGRHFGWHIQYLFISPILFLSHFQQQGASQTSLSNNSLNEEKKQIKEKPSQIKYALLDEPRVELCHKWWCIHGIHLKIVCFISYQYFNTLVVKVNQDSICLNKEKKRNKWGRKPFLKRARFILANPDRQLDFVREGEIQSKLLSRKFETKEGS